MSVCSEFSCSEHSQRSADSSFLPVLPYSTSSASRKSLLKKEFQQNFGKQGSRSKGYVKALKLNKKPSIAIVHANRVLEYSNLERWLKKRNISHSSVGQMVLSNQEFIIFFKWFDMKMKRHSHEDGLNIDFIITDFIESGLFKQRSEAAHFLKSIDDDSNGAISCEEFREGLSAESNLHRVMQFKRFIKKIRMGEHGGPGCVGSNRSFSPSNSLPSVSRPSTTGNTRFANTV